MPERILHLLAVPICRSVSRWSVGRGDRPAPRACVRFCGTWAPERNRGMAWLRRYCMRLALSTVLALSGGQAALAATVRVGVEGGSETEAQRAATFGGDRCPAIAAFPVGGATRLDAELLILCNAFRAGGRTRAARVRGAAQLQSRPGRGRSPAGSTCRRRRSGQRARPACRRAAPIARRSSGPGEWQVGLYTTANRADVLAVSRRIEELQRLTGGGAAQLGRGLAGPERHRAQGTARRPER